ncbi:MAG: hypothetical protein K9N23_22265, partial [Akkermansiaceae bacterium]|nr:hypothetical protein [Akkermansiaceae bacterium]
MKKVFISCGILASGLLSAQDARYPTDPSAPAPVIHGSVADGTPPAPAPPKPPAAPPRILRSLHKPVERVHPSAAGGARQAATVRATLEFVAKPASPPEPIPLSPPPPRPAAAIDSAWLEQFRAARAARPPHSQVFISATVYDGTRSLIRWWISGTKGGMFSAWSNVDFTCLGGFNSFSWKGHDYSLLMSTGNTTAAAYEKCSARAAAAGHPIPPLVIPTLPADRPAFVLTKGDPGDAASLAPLEALHLLYQHEAPRLTAARNGREVARRARAGWLRLHPPQPQDITVPCWTSQPPRRLPPPAGAAKS